jgi:hypothetical protein
MRFGRRQCFGGAPIGIADRLAKSSRFDRIAAGGAAERIKGGSAIETQGAANVRLTILVSGTRRSASGQILPFGLIRGDTMPYKFVGIFVGISADNTSNS